MSWKYVFLPFLVLVSLAQAQTSIVIKGTVTDIATGKSLAGATVTLQSNDTLVNTVANDKGDYMFSSPLIKPDKVYVLYAANNSPLFGYYDTNECFASTYGLGDNPRVYVRNIVLKQNGNARYAMPPQVSVHFGFNDNTIMNPQRDSALNAWLKYLTQNPTAIVEIEGYADSKEGNKKFQHMLSMARAQDCINYLLTKDIQGSRLRLMGNGSINPVITRKEIRKLKGKAAKQAARLANCRAEISLKNMFFVPPDVITMKGLVTDINTSTPVNSAFVFFSGSDGTRVSTSTDSSGRFVCTVKNFNPLAYYNVVVEATGYNPSDLDDVFKINPQSNDLAVYAHHFRIEKNGYEKPFVFEPVLFDSGSVKLSQVAIDTLNKVKKIMNERPKLVLEFMGDADWHEPNYVGLASARAHACVDYLIAQGIDSARLITASRLNEAAIEDEEKTTNNIVKHKEKQRHFNPKKCTASFWIMRWDYEKAPSQ